MNDSLHRIISDSGTFFGIACDTTTLVNEACRKHDVGPTAAVALGRALTGAVLLAALLKDGQSVQLKFEGSGPLRKIITEAGYDGWARGYVAEPRAEVPLRAGRIDVASGIGLAGFLTVTKDIGMPQKYQGMVQLATSEIGEDIAYYLVESEQKPSLIALGTYLEPDGRVLVAGGYLIQTLPQVDEELIGKIETRVAGMPSLSQLLREGKGPADILAALFADVPHHPTGDCRLYYQCSCSLAKMQSAVFSLGNADLQYLLENGEGAEVQCEFCRDVYRLSKEDLAKMIALGQDKGH